MERKTNNKDKIEESIEVTEIIDKIEESFQVPGNVETPKTEVIMTSNKPRISKVAPLIGLYNRSDYNIHVVFKDIDIVIPPKGRSTKIYNEADIVSVQDKPLDKAVSLGIITVIR